MFFFFFFFYKNQEEEFEEVSNVHICEIEHISKLPKIVEVKKFLIKTSMLKNYVG